MRPLIACMCLLALPAVAFGADDCEHSKPLDIELEVDGAARLDLEAHAGFLVIEGESGLDRVIVEGRACASSESLLDDIELKTDRRGDRLIVEVDIPENNFSRRGDARLDLTVTVPTGLALSVEDGSGSIEISNVASLELEDGSGEVEVSDVSGDVEVTDGSGELDLRDITGRVTLSDGSGSVTLSSIGGGVHIEQDGSGEIRITRVQGDVEIDSDGSGSIEIRDVTGSVLVGSDGSGSIWVAQVTGDFELGSDGSGSVDLDDVGGTIKLP